MLKKYYQWNFNNNYLYYYLFLYANLISIQILWAYDLKLLKLKRESNYYEMLHLAI